MTTLTFHGRAVDSWAMDRAERLFADLFRDGHLVSDDLVARDAVVDILEGYLGNSEALMEMAHCSDQGEHRNRIEDEEPDLTGLQDNLTDAIAGVLSDAGVPG